MGDDSGIEFKESEAPLVHLIRDRAVILDSDLAKLYNTTTGPLNQAVKRNTKKFSERYGFQLNDEEFADLVSQKVISKGGPGGRRTAPWVFTQRGVIIVATILKSDRAVAATEFVVETFMKARLLEKRQVQLTKQDEPVDPAPSPIKDDLGRKPEMLQMMRRLLDTIIDQESGESVEDKGRSMLLAGIENLEARLKKQPLENAKIIEELKILRERASAEGIQTEQKRVELRDQRRASIARDMLMLSQYEMYVEAGDREAWHDFLYDLGEMTRASRRL